MSILLTRLLEKAEATCRAGAPSEAEALCAQVIHGALAVNNVALAADAIQAMGRIPQTGNVDRVNAWAGVFNYVVGRQRSREASAVETGLSLIDLLIEQLDKDGNLNLRRKALEMAIYIASNSGRDRMKYLGPLVAQTHASSKAGEEPLPFEVRLADGPELAARVLSRRGCVLVRGLFDPSILAKVARAGDTHFVRAAQQAVPLLKIDHHQEVVTGAAETFLTTALASFLPAEPKLQPELCYMRQVAINMPETKVPFHQDLNAFGRILVNCWVPLTACGTTAPGLEVIAERVDELTETIPAENQYDDLQISPELVAQRFAPDAILRPEMTPGDAIILLSTTIHRTNITPQMTQRRTSLELRFG